MSFGIIPAEGKINDACLPNHETKQCDGIIDFDLARQRIEDRCMHEPYCTINVLKVLDMNNGTDD